MSDRDLLSYHHVKIPVARRGYQLPILTLKDKNKLARIAESKKYTFRLYVSMVLKKYVNNYSADKSDKNNA